MSLNVIVPPNVLANPNKILDDSYGLGEGPTCSKDLQ